MRHFEVLLFAGLFGIGCGSKATNPPVAPTGTNENATAASQPNQNTAKANEVTVHIDDAIRKACGISDSKAYFAFDSSRLEQADMKTMHQLSQCFSTGPLQGRGMRLVGYADPRGEPEYNLVLGGERASSVKQILVRDGVVAGHIETTSRGEMEAKGYDEATWARDRRVDVRLAD